MHIPRGGAVQEGLAADSQDAVGYARPEDDCCVSVSGTAAVMEEAARKEDLWTPMAKAWFPDGPTDPNLALLVIKLQHAEYWDVEESKMVQLFKMAKAAVTGHPPTGLGEHKEVNLS